jgi:glycosyltransferase involved in cell wall biosynthesis
MKIGVFHNQPSGGARRALHGFCRELSKRHNVDVFTLSTADRALLDEPVRAVYDFAPRRPIRFGLYLNDWRRRLDLRDLERVHAAAARAIDAAGYDVVLADVDRFTGAPFALRYLRTPAAYYCHEPPRALYESAWRPHLTPYQRLRRLWREPLERAYTRRIAGEDRSLVRSARVVCTNSRYTGSRIRQIYGVEAAVCPPGVDVPALEPRSEEGGSYVLSVGALEPHKGYGFLVEALARVPPGARPPLRIVANDQNAGYRRTLEREAAAAGVKLDIRLRIPERELAAQYRDAALFAFGAHDEPLGLAPLEAMAHALPVLAVAEGGVNETVADGENGVLVSRDSDAFARALTSLLGAPERRRELGVNARRIVEERWNWPFRAEALESQLAALATGEPSASAPAAATPRA